MTEPNRYPPHEPFATSWLGIAMQLFVAAVLVILTVYLWRQL